MTAIGRHRRPPVLGVGVANYREHAAPADLAGVVGVVWERDGGAVRIVPDGAVDLIRLGGREVVVAGADTGPRRAEVAGHSVAVRLRPEAAGAVLGVPASEVRDRVVPLSEIWGYEPRDLVDAVRERHAVPDPLVAAAARAFRQPATIAEVAAGLGVTERTLHRRTLAAIGYGPKVLARVTRLRRLQGTTGPLAERAVAAGYASQAHMTDEVRRLAGATPSAFLT